jgi:hypothetical protein
MADLLLRTSVRDSATSPGLGALPLRVNERSVASTLVWQDAGARASFV